MKAKLYISLIIWIFATKIVSSQCDSTRKASGFAFEASYMGDALANFRGGIQKGTSYLGMACMKMTFDTQNAGWWRGGELFVHAANTHAGTPSATLIGDFQVASNLEAGNLTYVQELWFKQNIGNASFVIGLQDLGVEFLGSQYGALFLNSSFGIHSTIADNLPAPIFPLTSLGFQFHYQFSEKITAKIAIFDGVPDDFSVNPYNLKWRLQKNDGYLAFSEITFTNGSEKFAGTYKLGTYYHYPHLIETIHEGISTFEAYGENGGVYATIDQTVYKNTEGDELSCFLLIGASPKSVNEHYFYVGTGLNFKGLFNNRTNDLLGVGMVHATLNSNVGSEITFELSYMAELNENIFIQPDIQYIINPAATDTKLNNAFVGIIRLGIEF